jgi:two-component system, OmpR family, sensor histidine kinase KdpD
MMDTPVVEETRKPGKLKVFLGYAAGVGKTYAMLDAGRQRVAEGVDATVGWVDTHGEAETERLLAGLEVTPGRRYTYLGSAFTEMDLDAILARRPQLVLLDDLAHSNPPGARHAARYQDVEELLAAGINVYSTVNIQNLESLKDVVTQITGLRVTETIPDRVVDDADEIELVDLPPQELVRRVEESKVYQPQQGTRAGQKFYRHGNLAALREMALRRAAARVDQQMRSYMAQRDIRGPWAANERVIVCLGAGPLSDRLVRAGRRLATAFNAEWFAIHIETPGHASLSETQRDRLARALRLAEELGARAMILPGANVAEAVLHFARSHNVTRIVVGKSRRGLLWQRLGGSVVDDIIGQSAEIEVHVISETTPETEPTDSRKRRLPEAWQNYIFGLALVLLVTVLGILIRGVIAASNLVMLFLLAVMVAALRWGRGPAIMVVVLSVISFDYYFVPPHLTLAVSDSQYLITFFALLGVGIVISSLAARARDQAAAAERREAETTVLYGLSSDLAAAGGLADIVQAIITHVGQTFTRDVAVLLPKDGQLTPEALSPGFTFDEQAQAVAAWVLRQGQPAGRGAGAFPDAHARYLPLKTARGVVGVLGVRPADPHVQLTPEQRRLLAAFASQAALAIERAQLADAAGKAQILEATEHLQTALLNSISHDLRTPLASITGVLSSLRDEEARLDEETSAGLIDDAYQEAERLNHLVGNLLNMTRLEGGALRVSKTPGEIQDLVGTALAQMGPRLRGRPVKLDIPDSLPLAPMDLSLMTQVLVNILDNAVKYSPPGSPVEISAYTNDREAVVEVADRGVGIPPGDLTRVFDKFYRVQRPGSAAGTGLGLSISKGIVEAHGGRIEARNREGGGARLLFALPLTMTDYTGEM